MKLTSHDCAMNSAMSTGVPDRPVAMTLRRKTKPSPDAMTLGEHLAELRSRLIISVAAFIVAAIVVFIVYSHVLHFLQAPYCKIVPEGPVPRCT